MQTGGALLACIGDVGRELRSIIHANVRNDGPATALGICDGEAQSGGSDCGEANDAAVAYGGQSVALLYQCILQRQPLAIDLSLKREFPDTLSVADILFYEEAVEGGWGFKYKIENWILRIIGICLLLHIRIVNFTFYIFK